MNKKIKIIELYNKVANKDLPKQIRWEDMIWTLDEGRDYISETGRTLGSDVRLDELNNYVEILEDNTEEIEELPNELLDEKNLTPHIIKHFNKINELVRAVKEIRKDLNK